MSGITWNRITAAAESRGVAITAELAGYLLLGVVDALGGQSTAANPEDICLDREGRVLVRRLAPCTPGTSDLRLRELLSAMLKVSVSSCAALTHLAAIERDASNQEPFAEQLQKALIPLNRAAARRALSRLHRDLVRIENSGQLVDLGNGQVLSSRSHTSSLQPSSNATSPSMEVAGFGSVTDLASASSPDERPPKASPHLAQRHSDLSSNLHQIPDLVVPSRLILGDCSEECSNQSLPTLASESVVLTAAPAQELTAPLEATRPVQLASSETGEGQREPERTQKLPRFCHVVPCHISDCSPEAEAAVARDLTVGLPQPSGTLASNNLGSDQEPEASKELTVQLSVPLGAPAPENTDSSATTDTCGAQGHIEGLSTLPTFVARQSPVESAQGLSVAEACLTLAPVPIVASIEPTLPLPLARTGCGVQVPTTSAGPFVSAVEPTRALPLIRRRRTLPLCVHLENDDAVSEEQTSVDNCFEVSEEQSPCEQTLVEQPGELDDSSVRLVIRAGSLNPSGASCFEAGRSADELLAEPDAEGYEELDAAELVACDGDPCADWPQIAAGVPETCVEEPCAWLQPSSEHPSTSSVDDWTAAAGSATQESSAGLASLGNGASSAAGWASASGLNLSNEREAAATKYGDPEKVRAVSYSSIEGLSQQFAIEPLWSEHELSRGLRVVAGVESASGDLSHTPPPMVEQLELERPEQLEPTRRLGRVRTFAVAGLVLGAVVLSGQFSTSSARVASASPAAPEPLNQICRASISVDGVGPEQRVQIRQQGEHHFRQPSSIVGKIARFSGLWCARDAELLVIEASSERMRRIPIPSERLKPNEIQPWVSAELHLDW